MCVILSLFVLGSQARTRWCGLTEFPDKLFAAECFVTALFRDGLLVSDRVRAQRLTWGQVGFCIYNVTSNTLTHAPGSNSLIRKWIADRSGFPRELEYICHYDYREDYREDASRQNTLARLAHDLRTIQQSLDALANIDIGEEMVVSGGVHMAK